MASQATRAAAQAHGPSGPAERVHSGAQNTLNRYRRMITGIGIPINHSKTPRMNWSPWHTIGHVHQTSKRTFGSGLWASAQVEAFRARQVSKALFR